MSISYEEALATLEAMFGAPWTRESLDLVLRHEKGHMENTCDRILSYGSENDPQGLLRQLQSGQGLSSSGGNVGGGDQQAAHNINMDEEIARQLAAQQGGAGGGAAASAGAPTTQQKGRGTPTVLPKDFLRIPGYPHRSVLLERASGAGRSGVSSGTSAMNGAEMDDETLARMLQDEFFSQELARNPEFAHLAGGRVPHRTGRSGATFPPGQRRSTTTSQSRQQQQALPQGPNIIDKLSGRHCLCSSVDLSEKIRDFSTGCPFLRSTRRCFAVVG